MVGLLVYQLLINSIITFVLTPRVGTCWVFDLSSLLSGWTNMQQQFSVKKVVSSHHLETFTSL